MNRRYNKQGRVPFQHFNCLYPENRYKQHMQQPIKRSASDPQCLKLVTDVCKQQSTDLSPGTSSAFFSMGRTCICCKLLKHIGHNIACLLCAQFVVLSILSQNQFLQRFETAATGHHYVLRSIGVGFVSVQPGLLQRLLGKVHIIGYLKVCSFFWDKF